jgi:adenosylmethionine-8-amino-7-oxononanoate aminotransferase
MKPLSSHVFHRQFQRPLPVAVTAEGVWIEDADGKRYLDASGGPLVVNVGHGREEIARALHHQIMTVDYVHPTMFTTGPVEELARRLAEKAPPDIERFYFMSSGSEAVETAVKLARQIHLAHGRSQRFRLISRWGSYHGLTLGALSATGKPAFRAPFTPMLIDVVHIPAPYCYRCAFGLRHPDCGLRCADALEVALHQAGTDTVSAFLAETVSGATIAAVPPPPGYFRKIREICNRYGILLILDEVLCGLGRTGRWFASEHFDVIPDIVTLGKGLGGGAVALSAIGVRTDHFDAVRKSGGFIHGGTFSHHPPATSVGNAVMEILESEKLVDRVAKKGTVFLEKIRQRVGSHPHVGDIRGIGYLWGIEIVKDRTKRESFPRSERIAEKLWSELFNRGIIVYTATGFAMPDGDALVIGPPFIVTDDQMNRIIDAIADALKVVPGACKEKNEP